VHGGFGLIDALVALTLLAVCLLGIGGGVHYALRSTQAALLQTQAVDLIADLSEDLHSVEASEVPSLLSEWRARVRRNLPARNFAPPRITRIDLGQQGQASLAWVNVEMQWNGPSGVRDGALSLPVTAPGAEALQ
jgi:hypothetical protein